MTIGIDSYSFHRYFGEDDSEAQPDPGVRWTLDTFLSYASELGVSLVSLEMRFLPGLDRSFLCSLRGRLRDLGLEPILAWRPQGGEEGKNGGELARDLLDSLEAAVLVGSTILRVMDGTAGLRRAQNGRRRDEQARVLAAVAPIAARQGVTMAVENSVSMTSTDLIDLIALVHAPSLGVSFDTGAALRAQEDPAAAAGRLGGLIRTVQVKDLAMDGGQAARDQLCAPAGRGVIDLPAVVRELRACGYAGGLNAQIDVMASPWRAQREEDIIRQSVLYLRQMTAL